MFWWIGVYATLLWAYNNFLESLIGILYGAIRGWFRKQTFPERYGPWAVITGATDGIGKCYAEMLAGKGLKIVLISRSESKLMKVAEEIEQKYGVEVKWIAVDFSKGPEIYDYLKVQLAAFDIGMLVNNVGHFPMLDQFSRHSEADLLAVININIVATTMLTRMVLPDMKIRRRGIVINIASSAGIVPSPYMTAYAASKSFVISLSLALKHELGGSGVECQVVAPSIVRTNMQNNYTQTIPWYVIVLSKERLVEFAMYTIGKTAYTCGHWLNCIQACSWTLIPRSLVIRSIADFMVGGVDKGNSKYTM